MACKALVVTGCKIAWAWWDLDTAFIHVVRLHPSGMQMRPATWFISPSAHAAQASFFFTDGQWAASGAVQLVRQTRHEDA